MDIELLKKEAAWVVLMFDQANTNKVVEVTGNGRGELLRDAVEDLRKTLGGTEEVHRLAGDGTWIER